MSDKIETIEIHGESSVDWKATAFRYIELNKQKTEAIQRVRELHKPGKAYLDDQPMCIHCRTVEFPCPTIKALDGEQG